ncbi:unnamed protein product [Brassicogethes aeneus]|uniref:CHK kinase-like domain-containing protein n=1 Tax=Brassicogethes aeneus TaxID=1431903 RepID=A0A9P0BJ66_BRAAE|nr:unnamed protein product [Brassicogethes aeneus]
MCEIENLSDLLKGQLDEELEYVDYSAKSLLGPGENFGSIMLSVDIKCKNKKTNKEEIIHAVAKTPPISEFMQRVFKTDLTFKPEIEFYRTVFPLLQEFQKKHGMKPLQYHAKFLGGRLNLKNTDAVDSNAVLLIENIAVKGFKCADRLKGFDLETIKLILQDLANLHATGIALKLQCPDEFNKKVKPYVNIMIYGDDASTGSLEDNIKVTRDILGSNEEVKPFLHAVIEMLRKKCDNSPKEPFATIVHQDLWVNNMMLKEENGKFIENKFVDFPICRYVSPADDLFFLLLTSVQNDIILEKWDFLVQFYHEQFIDNLKKFDVNTEPFSREAFDQEIKDSYQRQYFHASCLWIPLLMDKSKAKPLGKDFDPKNEPPMEPSEAHKKKLCTIVKLYNKNGWL